MKTWQHSIYNLSKWLFIGKPSAKVAQLAFLCLLFFFAACTSKEPASSTAAEKKGKAKSKSIFASIDTTLSPALIALHIENPKIIEDSNKEVAILRDLIMQAEILADEIPYQKEEIVKLLEQTDSLIKSLDYELSSNYSGMALSLKFRKFDCDILSFLYLSIAEQKSWPLHAVYSPGHMSLVWKSLEEDFYWETTSGELKSKKFYLNKNKLSEKDLDRSILLKPLSKKQLTALWQYNIAKAKFEKGKSNEALKNLYKSIEIESDWYEPYYLMAKIFERNADFERGEEAYKMAYLLLPSYPKMLHDFKKFYKDIGCLEELQELENGTYSP